MTNTKKESILRAASGEIESRVNYELGKIVDNILDLRTSPTAKRTITVKLNLIDRQKAEIERLQERVSNSKHALFEQQDYTAKLQNQIKTARVEAVKEFAERLKEDIINIQMNEKYQHYAIPTKKVDKLLKEMGVVE